MTAVSVVMAVRDGADLLPEALDSILGQTFKDLECLVVDDASSDETPAILREAASRDNRITILANATQRGLAASLNRGITESQADLIARQDADDVSEPTRLARQVDYLNQNADVDIVGTGSRFMDFEGRTCFDQPLRVHTKDGVLNRLLRGKMLFAHGSVMFRKRFVEKAGLYNEGFLYGQDHELWLRGFHHQCNVGCIPDCLYRFRLSPVVSTRKRVAQRYLKNLRLAAFHDGQYPVQVDREELHRVMDEEGKDVPYPMAAYYLNLAVLVIKRRSFSLGAWRYLWRSLRSSDRWFNHFIKIPLFVAALIPFRIGMRLSRQASDRLLWGGTRGTPS